MDRRATKEFQGAARPPPPAEPAEPSAKRARPNEQGERISFESDDEEF